MACAACGRVAFDPQRDASFDQLGATLGCQGGARVVVDEYASGLASTFEIDVIGSTQLRETNLAGVLGGSRTVTLSMTAGSGSVKTNIDTGHLTFSSGALSDGAIELLYDGQVFDFSDCGTAAVTTAFSDIGLDVTLALTDAASQTAQLTQPGTATASEMDVTLSLNDPVFAGLDRAHITQIVIHLDGQAGADFSVAASGAR